MAEGGAEDVVDRLIFVFRVFAQGCILLPEGYILIVDLVQELIFVFQVFAQG